MFVMFAVSGRATPDAQERIPTAPHVPSIGGLPPTTHDTSPLKRAYFWYPSLE